jgi:GT2 family glycosyltransferase
LIVRKILAEVFFDISRSKPLIQVTLISAVTVNYRSWDKLRACLDSLPNSNLIDAQLEVVVVDNCSKDDQMETFVEQYPSVSFILNKGNFRFSNGCNTGVNKATGDYLFL